MKSDGGGIKIPVLVIFEPQVIQPEFHPHIDVKTFRQMQVSPIRVVYLDFPHHFSQNSHLFKF